MPDPSSPAPDNPQPVGRARLDGLKARIEAARLAKEAAGEPPAAAEPAAAPAAASSPRSAPAAPYVPTSFYTQPEPPPRAEGAPATMNAAALAEVRSQARTAMREHRGVVFALVAVFLLVVVAEIVTFPSDIEYFGSSGGGDAPQEVEPSDLAVMVTATRASAAGVGWAPDHVVDEKLARTTKVRRSDGSYHVHYSYSCAQPAEADVSDAGNEDYEDDYEEDWSDVSAHESGSGDSVQSEVVYCKDEEQAAEKYDLRAGLLRSRGDSGGGVIEYRARPWGEHSICGVISDQDGTTSFFAGHKGRHVFSMQIQNCNLPIPELDKLLGPMLKLVEDYRP